MQATTIKIENPLLSELKKFLPKGESISSFIREVLERDLQRRKMIKAAETYMEFLDTNPEEKQWLEDWGDSDLITEAKTKSKTKRERKR